MGVQGGVWGWAPHLMMLAGEPAGLAAVIVWVIGRGVEMMGEEKEEEEGDEEKVEVVVVVQ